MGRIARVLLTIFLSIYYHVVSSGSIEDNPTGPSMGIKVRFIMPDLVLPLLLLRRTSLRLAKELDQDLLIT